MLPNNKLPWTPSASISWPGTAEELGALLRADIERYGKIARSVGLTKQ